MKCIIIVEYEDKWTPEGEYSLKEIAQHVEDQINSGEWVQIAKVASIKKVDSFEKKEREKNHD